MRRRFQEPLTVELVPVEVDDEVIQQNLADIGTLLYRFFRQTDSPRPLHRAGTP